MVIYTKERISRRLVSSLVSSEGCSPVIVPRQPNNFLERMRIGCKSWPHDYKKDRIADAPVWWMLICFVKSLCLPNEDFGRRNKR
jgi:hypothetical protein